MVLSKTLIKNARIIDSGAELDRTGDILINDAGEISAIGENINSKVDFLIDATGLVASPGLVDMHVHTRDPGFTHKETILTIGDCAAIGGVTSLAAMPNTQPATDNAETIEYIIEQAKKSKVKIYPVAAVTKDLKGLETVDFAQLKKAGAIAFSDDGEPVSNAKMLAQALKETSWLGSTVLSHCEDKSLSASGIMNEGAISQMLGVEGVPCSSESVGIAREIALASALNARVHICHVSTAEGLEFIRFAKHAGVKVSAETCPHYFALNEESLLHQDADYRMNPPLRSEHDKRAVIRAIIDGTIDAIATDHAPHTIQEKSDFYNAPNGVIGLETSLAAGITYLVNTGYISLFKLIYMMSTVPAQILGINAGSLTIGSPADIVVFSPSERWVVKPELFQGNSRNSPFKGMELCGRVKFTFCDGNLVYQDKI